MVPAGAALRPDLRFRLALVTDAGSGPGREVATRLAWLGAAVLVADPDAAAARATAAGVAERRTRSWSFAADVTRPDDRLLLAARARDLGGADLLVTATRGDDLDGAAHLARLFLDDLATRRGRRDHPGAVVLTAPGHLADALRAHVTALAADAAGARVHGLVADPVDDEGVRRTAAAALDLLVRSTTGEVVAV